MKIQWNIQKKYLIYTGIVAVISVIAHFMAGISTFNMLLFILLYGFVKNLDVTLSPKLNGLWTALAILTGGIFSVWTMQYLLLVQDLRERITREKLLLNICCCLICYLIVQILLNRVGRACMVTHILMMCFAGVDYFVYAFRGNELTFGDLRSIGTGLSVAANYQFRLNAQAMNAILISVIYIAAVRKLNIRCRYVLAMRVACISAMILLGFFVAARTTATVTETWEQKGSYRNGYLLNFVLSIRDSFVDKPEDYSVDKITELEQEYGQDQEDAGKNGSGDTVEDASDETEKKPVIIAIMDESFADFRVIGDLATNQPVMPFIDSLSENTIKGYALSSVFGAKTPNSEWEFMTGNSMAWLPAGSVAYQQYLKQENAYSIVDTLKKEDYTCVAMHPYYATGWSRDTVYPKLGFDETYFLDDFDQSRLVRKYVSDEVMFDKIIERYEQNKGQENLFLMGITMQNHGGYTDYYSNFSIDTYGTSISYTDVNQYLTLAHKTDQAVKKLITYFEKEDQPVIICFFGDHQPSLNTAFYYRLNGKGLSGLSTDELEELYEVPFFIWTNYESESQMVERTSLNFLSTMLLERAGITLPPYQKFLSDLMEVVPAMNARAYYSQDKGRYVHYGNGSAFEEQWLQKYQMLQYNGLFDRKKRSAVFFGR